MNPHFAHFQQLVNRKFWWNWFLLKKLPLSFIAGVKLKSLQIYSAQVMMSPQKLNGDADGNIHFAALSIAAEMSSALLVWGHTYRHSQKIAVVLARCEGQFYKKANSTVTFTCQDGKLIETAIAKAAQHQQAVMIQSTTVGLNEYGEIIAAYTITWSFQQIA